MSWCSPMFPGLEVKYISGSIFVILSIILYLLLNIANKLDYFCLELIRSMFSLVCVEFGGQIHKYLCGCYYSN